MKETQGTELMRQLNSGELELRQSEIAQEVKGFVTTAMEEIITAGARVRPLKLNGKRVGWIRPLAYAERKVLDRLFEDEDERIVITLKHCTTLTEDEILNLDIHELNSILYRLHTANAADLSLFPYLSAFVTTQMSQNLWNSRHDRVFDKEKIHLPDGGVLSFMAAPDHISLWANLSTIREQSITRLEQSLNFGTLIKAQVGKQADKYVNDLIKSLNGFQPDSIEPWIDIVDFMKVQSQTPVFGDGYGHSHQDNSVQGLMREMKGMLEGDRHEQLMETFYEKQLNEARRKEDEIQQIIQRRRAELESDDAVDVMVVHTDAEVRRREREIHAGSLQAKFERQLVQELENQGDDMTAAPGNERMAKYFAKEQ